MHRSSQLSSSFALTSILTSRSPDVFIGVWLQTPPIGQLHIFMFAFCCSFCLSALVCFSPVPGSSQAPSLTKPWVGANFDVNTPQCFHWRLAPDACDRADSYFHVFLLLPLPVRACLFQSVFQGAPETVMNGLLAPIIPDASRGLW